MCMLVGYGVSIIGSVIGNKIVIWKEDRVCRKNFLGLAVMFASLTASLFYTLFREASSIEDPIGGLKAYKCGYEGK